MKILLFIFSISFFTITCEGQDTSAIAYQDPGISLVMDKWLTIKERTNGAAPGYRIKIHFGGDRDKANSVKLNFRSIYQHVPVYDKYQQPNFTVVVGDFRTRVEAYKFLKEISLDYPYAFIVQDNIFPPKVERP